LSEQHRNVSTSGTAVAGFVLGLVSCFLNFFGIVAILAITFSSIAIGQRHTKKGLAITGLILGMLNLLYAFSILMSL